MCKWTDRDSQINKACAEFSSNRDTRIGFVNGAMWADKTMIIKACEWLKETMMIAHEEDIDWVASHYHNTVDEMIEDFRKAMEE